MEPNQNQFEVKLFEFQEEQFIEKGKGWNNTVIYILSGNASASLNEKINDSLIVCSEILNEGKKIGTVNLELKIIFQWNCFTIINNQIMQIFAYIIKKYCINLFVILIYWQLKSFFQI